MERTASTNTSSSSEKRKIKENLYDRYSYQISNGLENFFYRLGYSVASNPWITICTTIFIVAICALGLINFRIQKDPYKLWVPEESKFAHDTQWLTNNIEEAYRLQSVLLTSEDVLQPHVLKKLAQISNEVTKVKAVYPNGTTFGWQDICFKIPIIAELMEETTSIGNINIGRRKRQTDFDDEDFYEEVTAEKGGSDSIKRIFNPSVDLDPDKYCKIINKLPNGCLLQNLLEIWKFDENVIGNLTKSEILDAINVTTISPYSGHESNFVQLLGNIQRNESGHIIAAGSIISNWMVYINFSDTNHDKIGNIAGTQEWASEEALLWEEQFIVLMNNLHLNQSQDDGIGFFYQGGRSFSDLSAASMFQDMDKIFIGGVLMFIFMEIVLSKFSWIELRLLLSSMGLLSVGLAYISSIGISSAFGVRYGPVHSSLPFLLMGLGVDDIFVMMACWRQVEATHVGCSLPEQMGLMLKHAGTSITITSFTDVVAFLIGAVTVLPSLESFCIYAACGVFLTYIFAITFVVAIFTLDQKRIESKGNAFIPCLKHDTEKTSNLCCELNLMQRFIKFIFTKFVFTWIGKTIIITIVICSTAYSLDGLFKLKQKFEREWLVSDKSYYHHYLVKEREYYPEIGWDASIFMGSLNYTMELPKIFDMVQNLENQTDIVHDVSSWISPFCDFVKIYYSKDIFKNNLTDYEWRLYLSKFLFGNSGGKYQANFKFAQKLKCGELAPNVTIAMIPFHFTKIDERNDYVSAMHRIEKLVDDTHLDSGDGFATVWGKVFGHWVTDEVIDAEVLRNVLLALACVMICTTLMIANIRVCFFIFLCVLLTLINVCGFMQRWGITIDVVCCIALELAVGLCVDYATHIGHTFLTISSGTRTERALETVVQIGGAVMYGGGSTLLSLAMLANTDAYIFRTFFKIFLLVVIFGLFHGIMFLPVILSLVGPDAYRRDKDFKFNNGNKNDHQIHLDVNGFEKSTYKNANDDGMAEEMITIYKKAQDANDDGKKVDDKLLTEVSTKY